MTRRQSKNRAWRAMMKRLRAIRVGDRVARGAPDFIGEVTSLYTSFCSRGHDRTFMPGPRITILWQNGVTSDGPLWPSTLHRV